MSSLRPVQGSARELLGLLHEWQRAPTDPGPLVITTSGSTGEPKRVRLSRAAMRASARGTHARLGGAGQWLLTLPPAYVAGAQVLFRSVLAGSAPVLLDEHASLRAAARAMTGARRYTSLVPTQLIRMLASEEDTAALAEFDAVLLGGAATEPALHRAAKNAGLNVVATYGMSETCGGCVYDGVPLDGVAVAISPEGRIRIAGPVLFDGYDGRPELTAQVLRDGWFFPSDFGRLDDDGRISVLGRIDDVVVSGGVNVPTTVVASRLREHEHIRTAEVFGVPDHEWGHRVAAAVVLSADLDLADLREFVGDRLPRTWAPRQLVVLEEIPVLENGKVDRVQLRELAAG